MRLNNGNSMAVYKTFQVLIKMAVIVIAIRTKMETCRGICQVFNCIPDTQNLQGLFAADAGGCFKITLQGAGADFIFF